MTPSAADVLTALARLDAPAHIPEIVRRSGWARITVIRSLEILRELGKVEPVGRAWQIREEPEVAPPPAKVPKPKPMVFCGPLLTLLEEGPASVAALAERTQAPNQLVSRRLGYLREIGRVHYLDGLWQLGAAPLPARPPRPDRVLEALRVGEADRFVVAERADIPPGTTYNILCRLQKTKQVRFRLSEFGRGHQRRQLWRLA